MTTRKNGRDQVVDDMRLADDTLGDLGAKRLVRLRQALEQSEI
jgi:hypothetical protein